MRPGSSAAKVSLEGMVPLLLRTPEAEISELMAGLSVDQRAHLAVFCYSRVHLHRIGILIAATCDRAALVAAAASELAGERIYAKSREEPKKDALSSHRRVTLPKSASGSLDLAEFIASMADEEPDVY